MGSLQRSEELFFVKKGKAVLYFEKSLIVNSELNATFLLRD